jgi:hypothetical protein
MSKAAAGSGNRDADRHLADAVLDTADGARRHGHRR